MSLDGELDHGEPVRRGSDRRRPMRRVACRDEANGREAERVAQFAGELQMTAMDRIERAAENAEDGIIAAPIVAPAAWRPLPSVAGSRQGI